MKRNILAIAVAFALSSTVFAQTGTSDTGSNGSSMTQRTDDTTHHGFNYGWLGLLGLAGLAGLRRNDTRPLNSVDGTTR